MPSTTTAADAPPSYRPARREARLVAFVVDALLMALLLPGFAALGGLVVLLQTDWLAVDPSATEWAWGYAVTLLWLVVPLVYFTVGAVRGGTVGARLLRLSLRDANGAPLRAGRALRRALVMYPSLGLLGAGAALALAREDGRTLHDLAAGAWLVEAPERGR